MLNSGFLHTNTFFQNIGMQNSLINTGVRAIQVSKPLTFNIKDLEHLKIQMHENTRLVKSIYCKAFL